MLYLIPSPPETSVLAERLTQIMLLALSFGFLLGALAVVAAEAAVVLLILDRLRRRSLVPTPSEPPEPRDLHADQSLAAARNKKGFVWVLEAEKVLKVGANESPTRGTKEHKNKKEIVEVFPVRKYGKIKDHSLILFDLDGSQTVFDLRDCTIVAVSASDLSSRKWAKRYPIKLESKNSLCDNGKRTYYLYAETSWEKESWCKALRLASCSDKEKLGWYVQLNEQFHGYLTLLNAEYPSFLKPSALLGEASDKTNKMDGGSSRVRLLLKKLAKKASKTGVDYKSSSVSSSTRGERKIGDKVCSLHDASFTIGLLKSSSTDMSSSNSLQDLVAPASPSIHFGDRNQSPVFSDIVGDEKVVSDDGTLCWNLLLSRLFFDAKRSIEINNSIKARIQRTLSNMRTPSYIGGVTLNDLDLGNLPPYIHSIKVLPMDLNEAWAVEVDIEYSGGIILDIETRLEVREPELQRGIINTSSEPSSSSETTAGLLEGIEYYGNHLKQSGHLGDEMENRNEDKIEELKQSKAGSRTSAYMSRWKAIVQSFADQVSQVPLSLTIRGASLRGTLRLQIKPPPSDLLWFGFTTMPEIDWSLESSVGDRKITSSQIALLIGNRFKASILESFVLPNCECIHVPWMLAEKDDWVPRKIAPFIWINHEATDVTGPDALNGQHGEANRKLDGSNGSKVGPAAHPDSINEKINLHVQEPAKKLNHEIPTSQTDQLASEPLYQSMQGSTTKELRIPLLGSDERQASCSKSRVEPSETPSTRGIVTSEEHTAILHEVDSKPKKIGRRAILMDLSKKMGEKLEEKRRHIEEKSRHIVEKMRENSRP